MVADFLKMDTVPSSNAPNENVVVKMNTQPSKSSKNKITVLCLFALTLIVVGAVSFKLLKPFLNKVEIVENLPFQVVGILYNKEKPSAVINGKIVHIGDVVDGFTVAKISKDSVEFQKEGKSWQQSPRAVTTCKSNSCRN